MINRIKRYDWRSLDYSLVLVAFLLCIVGAFVVQQAGAHEGKGMHYMKMQVFGIVLGIFVLFVMTLLDYHFICRFSIFLYPLGLLMTFSTHTPLGTDNGTDAVRWIRVFGISFQPTEIMKILFILSLASFFVYMQGKLTSYRTFFLAVAMTIPPVLLILTQPDLSSSMVILFILVIMTFASGMSFHILGRMIAIAVPCLIGLFWAVQQKFADGTILTSYQYERIQAFLHPEKDVNQLNFQQNLSMHAIAEGGLYGKFLQDGGKGVSSRAYSTVPVNESDFIWSVVGEEFGFLGCLIVLFLFAFIIIKCFLIARKAQDYLGMMIAVGVASLYMFQVFCNICVATRLFPNTGLPLPFISNGLSSMMSSMIGIGLVINISIQPVKSSKSGFSMRSTYQNDADVMNF